MRSQIILTIFLVASLMQCDQSPTTLDEEPYLGGSGEITFSMNISRFEFDYLSQQFFFSVEVSSPLEITHVTAHLGSAPLPTLTLPLNDLGQEADILVGDGRYDGVWTLADSLSTYVDSLWNLLVEVQDNASNSLSDSKNLQPERPSPPVLSTANHLDTLMLLSDALVLDTLTIEVSHANGLDEIRDVSMMSLKPDGTYANSGQPIPLYDDGGSEVFYSFGGIDFTSGDSLANDGVYSLLLPLDPSSLSGIYHWTFNSRTWLGIEAIPALDSIVVLPAASLSRAYRTNPEWSGVFR